MCVCSFFFFAYSTVGEEEGPHTWVCVCTPQPQGTHFAGGRPPRERFYKLSLEALIEAGLVDLPPEFLKPRSDPVSVYGSRERERERR